MSWAVLKQDRELVLFPVMSAGALAILAGLMFGIGSSLGTVDRLSAAEPTAGEADIVLLAVTYFVLAFVVIYFNSALIGAAMIRLAGGDPTVGDGLRMANKAPPADPGMGAHLGDRRTHPATPPQSVARQHGCADRARAGRRRLGLSHILRRTDSGRGRPGDRLARSGARDHCSNAPGANRSRQMSASAFSGLSPC